VGYGCVLDARRALYHETDGWLAVADIHYGHELNRTRQRHRETLQPHWCMAATETRLMELLHDYQPRTLVLNGDVMDGGGSWRDAVKLIERVRSAVPELIFIEGNHERRQVKEAGGCKPWHRIGRFLFQHGHKFEAVLAEARFELEHPSEFIHITGHEHPVVMIDGGEGPRQKVPALIQQRLRGTVPAEHWIMPAFSPWAGASVYASQHDRIGTWLCEETQVSGSRLAPPL
jgi:metallophosphoesterase superfamily enzyme